MSLTPNCVLLSGNAVCACPRVVPIVELLFPQLIQLPSKQSTIKERRGGSGGSSSTNGALGSLNGHHSGSGNSLLSQQATATNSSQQLLPVEPVITSVCCGNNFVALLADNGVLYFSLLQEKEGVYDLKIEPVKENFAGPFRAIDVENEKIIKAACGPTHIVVSTSTLLFVTLDILTFYFKLFSYLYFYYFILFINVLTHRFSIYQTPTNYTLSTVPMLPLQRTINLC